MVYFYVKTGLHLFYKNIDVKGLENIPKNKSVLFVANHQNAMMDPILVATHNARILYFLARASAFKNKIAAKLLNAIHAIAIYRVRDGVNSKELNKEVFIKCVNLLSQNKTILIFPEGNHNIKKRVRSLRSGFVQISYDFLRQNPAKELYIVPIGLNYVDSTHYPDKVSIIYGNAICVNSYFELDYRTFTGKLIPIIHKELKKIVVDIPLENYSEIYSKIPKNDFLEPIKTNEKINNSFYLKTSVLNQKTIKKRNIFYYLMLLNTIPAFLFWKWIQPKIKQKEFIATAKFSVGLTLFPLVYMFQSMLVYSFFGLFYSLTYWIISVLIVLLTSKTN